MLTGQTLQAWLTAEHIGQRVFGPLAPRIVGAIGWSGFFAVCAVLVLPGLALVPLATRVVSADAGPASNGK